MRIQTARRLALLNHEFYQTFAGEFAEARHVLQPGLRRAMQGLQTARTVLDLGCGDGRTAQALADLVWAGEYLGLDASEQMLEKARARRLGAVRATFAQGDLTSAAWAARLPRQQFDAVVLFAVLHHIPRAQWRALLVRQAAGLLARAGRMVVSTWQFLEIAELRQKIVGWEAAGLRASEVEKGDYLLDWQRGGTGLRYVAALDETALRGLAGAAGLRVLETYRSDGRTRRLGLYAVVEKPG